MKHLSILCLAAIALGAGSVAAQENGAATTKVTLFEGQPIERLRVSGDETLPVTSPDEQTFTLAPGSSLILRGGRYKLTAGEEGEIVLHKIDQTIRYQQGKVKSKNRK